MPKYYLLRANGSYSDVMEAPTTPPSRTDGTWVEGTPPADAIPYTLPNPAADIQATLAALSDSQLTILAPFISEGKVFMDTGRWGVVLGVLNKVTTTDTEVQGIVAQLKILVETLANG